ncbi:ABC transporter substrate-binding protein [Arthrobacter cryoconiti]|uniref:ABC transporter substrate-binding protein n=1 Tax=Arthrobacter cryoconiti TaxID=748907 RepID=A0ABV8R2C0_9MICC|nr:ABC transporter substrate-binding protein [Arthrobacter cryoconiti]MCC9069811.1 ABC transporter substrate-binding protein [Arthrobacter cryoconiti]
MKSKTGKLTAVFCALTLTLGMAACGTGANKAGAGSELKDKVTVAVNVQPPTLDVQLTTTSASQIIMRNVYESLVTLDKNYEVTTALAEKYTTSEDGKTYLFDLRKGVKFQNGKEMTSADVVASMTRWAALNAKAIQFLPGVTFTSKGDYVVEMTLQERAADALNILAAGSQMAAIMPKELVPPAGKTQVSEFVGTGPYKFVKWEKDQFIQLSKYDDYKDNGLEPSGNSGNKAVFVKDLIFRFITDPSTRAAGVRSGQYDIATNIPASSYDTLKSQKNVKVFTEPTGHLISVFNQRSGPTSNLKVRQAINAAMDSTAIMNTAFPSEKLVHLTADYMPSTTRWASDAGKEEYNQHNVAKAKQLLSEAGYNGEPIHILTSRDYDYMFKAAVVIQQQLEAVGMKVDLDVTDYATVVEKRSKDTGWDMAMASFVYQSNPSQLYAVSSTFAGSVKDVPKRDQLLKDLRAAATPEAAQAVWATLQGYIWTDYLPFVFYGDFDTVFIGTDKVQNLELFQGVIGQSLKVSK